MAFVATTITEHIQYYSEIKGQIKNLESLHAEGILSKELFKKKVAPLRRELKENFDGEDGGGEMKTDHLTVVQ